MLIHNCFIPIFTLAMVASETVISTRCSDIVLLEPSIVRSAAREGIEMDMPELLENIGAVKRLAGGNKVGLLLVFPQLADISMEAHRHRDPQYEAIKVAEAIVICTLGHRLLADVYARMRSKAHPVKVFGDEEKALAWLRKQVSASANDPGSPNRVQ